MKMRKILAVLCCIAMLCTVLPLGAVVFAASNVVVNGDFENGSASWSLGSNTTVVADPTGAGKGNVAQAAETTSGANILAQNVTLEAATDYILTFEIYCYSASSAKSVFYLDMENATWVYTDIDSVFTEKSNTSTSARVDVNELVGAWYTVTLPFTSVDAASSRFRIRNYRASEGNYYIDNISIVKAGEAEGGETVEDPFLTNGDFETGDLTGWKSGYSGQIVSTVAHSGTYSHKTTNTASKYQGMMQQNPVKVAPNSDYTVTFWYYYEGSNATGSGASFYLYAQTTDNETNIKSITNYPKAANTWYQVTHTFNSGSNTEIALVWSNRMANDGGTYYFDDVVMTGPVPSDEPETPDTPVEPETPTTTTPDTEDAGNLVKNGYFNDGTATNWTVSGGVVEAYNGDYMLKATTTSRYDSVAKQTITVEANTDYYLDVKSLYVGGASKATARVHVYSGTSSTDLVSGYYWTISPNTPDAHRLEFNSGEYTQVTINVQQMAAASSSDTPDGNIYYDEFVMKKAAGESAYVGQYPEAMTSGSDIRFMTYNVLCGQDEANGGYSWGSDITGRPEKAFAMINYYKPDVIAFEEFSGEWYDAFTAQMTDYALGEMKSADSSKNNGKLYTCIAYNTKTIKLIETKLFRNTVSRWGTQGMRYVNVAILEVIATGERFIAAALHPDAGKLVGDQDLNGDGNAAEGDGYWRQFQLKEAGEYLAALSEEYQLPLIVGGDFNSGLDGTYDDYTSWYNFTDAGFTDATNGRYIDHIMYNGMATHLYETTVRDAAVSGASDHNAVFADIQFLDEFATPIKNAKDYIKTQGRTTMKDGAMWLDYSASGIEFSANCEGTVALNLAVNSIKNTDATYGGIYFTVIVDGVKKDRAECRITSTGSAQLVLAENLPAGNHTFEVYRQTEHRGAEVGISSIVMNGKFNEKPEDNRLYIEFIGDSISTGYGALGVAGDDQADSPKWQDATIAYPYLTAKALNADFSDVCYSGLGCKYGYSGSLSMQTVYTAQRYQYDKNTQYNFSTRQPDVVVIALGTNDIANQTDAALRKAGYQEMLDLVRAKNPDAKIVWIYGMMKDDDNAMIAALIEENGGGEAGLFSLELETNTSGAGWHPSAAGQQKFADDLVAFLNSDVLVKYVGDDMVDNDEGRTVSVEGTSRMEMDGDKLGLAFKFKILADGIQVVNGNVVDLSNATIDAFGNGSAFKLISMGAILSNNALVGLSDMKLDDVDGKKTIDINAQYLVDLEEDAAQFAVRITNIPTEHESTVIYARAYYVFEYEGRQVVMYDDIQAANYIDKYENNDGVLEW